MKKTLTIILSVLLVLMLSVGAMAADSDFKHMPDYFAVGKYTNSGAAEVVIPEKLNGEDTPVLYADSLGMNGLKGVTTLTISKGVTHIGDQNVMSGKDLTKISLPDTLEVIGRRNFYQMDVLTEVTVPGNVAYIGSDCFSSCKALTKVTFKGVCPTFGNNVFKNASADLVVYVPSSQIDAYTAALPEGISIKSSGKKVVASTLKVTEKDFAFDKETGTITGYTGKVGCFTIPAKIDGTPVKTIGKNAFFKNPFIAAVTIPEGVESIEQSAFAAPPMLSRVNFPSTLKTIGKGAFNGAKLDRLVLPEGLEIIGESAFHTAFGLNKPGEIVIPSTVTEIGAKAFSSHKAERVVIGENVQTIGSEAFSFSNNMTEIVILNKNKIEIAGDAFSKTDTEATLTLPEGISKDVYQSYVDLMAIIYPTCTVIEPENMEMGFPALDVMEGMPFFGTWHSVAVFDGTDYYTAELLGMVMDTVLNPDGTGSLIMEGENNPGGWYVKDGAAIFAPIFEEGGLPVEEEAVSFTMDENGRMLIDFGGLFVIFEQDGVVYSVPAIPEKPWPELNYDNMKYFIGKWEAVSYTMDGETYDAAMVGPMILVLNEDGTAQTIEEGEAPYDLLWAADYGTAYVGPTMNTAAEVTFDGTGNIVMEQDGASILMKPYVEPTPEPTPVPTPEPVDTSAILGHWDDGFKTLDIYEDGRIELTYKSDGYMSKMEWDIVDGKPTITEGLWENCPIVIENGLLIISNDTGVYQEYERAEAAGEEAYEADDDGDAAEIAALAVPVGEAGAPFIGTWTPVEMIMDGQSINVALLGMMMEITFNEDGTVAMSEDGEADLGVWSVQDGKAVVDTMVCALNDKGQLVMEDEEVVMILEKGAGGAEVSEEKALLALLAMMGDIAEYEMNTGDSALPEHLQGYVGEWYMVYMNFGGMSGNPKKVLGLDSKFTVNEDGTASVGFPIDKSGEWYEEDGNVYFGEEGMPLTLLSDGCLQYGSQLGGYFVFSKDANATWEPTAGQAMTLAPGVSNIPGATAGAQSAGFARMEDRLEKKFVAKTYTSFGQTMDASMLGAEYAVVFHENGLADFTLAGTTIQSLPWGLQKVPVGLSTVDAFSINYYGTMFNAALTDTGFDMDYYGTMTLHFVLAQ